MARKKYSIETTDGSDTGVMCAELLGRLDGNEPVVRLVFFGNPADNAEYAAQLATINERVAERFGDKRPVVTYVAQKPLQGRFKMEITTLNCTAKGEVDVKYGKDNYLVLTDPTGRELIVGGIVADDLTADAITQSDNVFGRLRQIMDAEGFPTGSIVRQWNYVEGITDFDGERQHYQDFNDARSRFYATTSWPVGYPAATGIGTRMGGIMVELNALIKGDGIIDMPLDNSLQVAAHSYSQEVLLGAVDSELKHKTTPKFERARLIGYPDDATVYISGTAAIRGEDSLTDNGTDEDYDGEYRISLFARQYKLPRAGRNGHGADFPPFEGVYKKSRPPRQSKGLYGCQLRRCAQVLPLCRCVPHGVVGGDRGCGKHTVECNISPLKYKDYEKKSNFRSFVGRVGRFDGFIVRNRHNERDTTSN